MMTVDPLHMCSNESERANQDIFADFKLKIEKLLMVIKLKALNIFYMNHGDQRVFSI